MNFSWPQGDWGWESNALQNLMSPTSNVGGATQSAIPNPATTIMLAPRPNWYQFWCQGWSKNVFVFDEEFLMQGGGANMFRGGTHYAFSDGHVRWMRREATLVPQGIQATTPRPANWPAEGTSHGVRTWVWPVGMWDKRQ